MKKAIQNLSTMLTMLGLKCVSLVWFTSCNDNYKLEETVLKPIAEHIVGKWQMTGYSIFNDGKWEEQSNDDNVAMAMDFRPDGTELRVMTYPDGFTALATRTWSVDEANDLLADSPSQQRIYLLAADELGIEASQSMNPGTGEIAQRQARWTYRRATPQDLTLTDRMVGKWQCSEVYMKNDDEWKPMAGSYAESYIELKEDGNCELYTSIDKEKSFHAEYRWSANTAAGLLRLSDYQVLQIEMPDDDKLVIYFGCIERTTRVIFVRENK